MEKVYNPKSTEAKWYSYWEQKGFFHVEPNSHKKPYTIVIPPPNVTDVLHMGHALNCTIQDIFIRLNRMRGYQAEWLPGTDHAGIATQNVVERNLFREGKTRDALGREEFLKRVWKWKEQRGRDIVNQLKRLGCSCDWQREQFTMNEELSEAVWEAFFRLYKKGLIYKGKYIINWCPRCRTALSDEEVEHEQEEGYLWYIRYPFKEGSGYITVATTRPETMLGDTAVAVNPEDRRYLKFKGKRLILPLLEREIPLIRDAFVDMEFGTGALKITPAHDPDDFSVGKRHGLESICVIDQAGRMNQNAGKYRELDRFEARNFIIDDLKKEGLVEKIQKYTHSLGHCYRCKTVIEPYLSEQWFVKTKPLAEPAIRAVSEGKIKFHPGRWKKVYINWMENIQDWCISRQIWWGHRIPIWYCDPCGEEIVAQKKPLRCPKCGAKKLRQEEDVLDTWFSSWLWPFSTFGWPRKTPDLEYFYPTDTLVTAPEIIFFWVARMIMAGYEFMGKEPFSDVYIHETVKDETGKKMSKSLGNVIDPLDIVEKYGADSLRFTLANLIAGGQDMYISESSFKAGRNFCNKIWNAARLLLSNLSKGVEDVSLEPQELSDRWILSQLNRTIGSVTDSVENYKFNEASVTLRDFFWHKYCDWYLELIKPRLYGSDLKVQRIALEVLEKSMRLLHPFMPFITEEIWQMLGNTEAKSIMVCKWPKFNPNLTDPEAEEEMSLLQEIIVALRNIREENSLSPSKKLDLFLDLPSKKDLLTVKKNKEYIKILGKVKSLQDNTDCERTDVDERKPLSTPLRGGEMLVSFEGGVEAISNSEIARIKKEIEKTSARLEKSRMKLSKRDFLLKAPEPVVEREKDKEKEYQKELDKLKRSLEKLNGLRERS